MLASEESCALSVEIRGKRLLIDAAVDSSFFVGFAGRGVGWRRIIVDASLGKGPASGAGSHQQELDIVIANAVADRRNVSDGCMSRRTFEDVRERCQQSLP